MTDLVKVNVQHYAINNDDLLVILWTCSFLH